MRARMPRVHRVAIGALAAMGLLAVTGVGDHGLSSRADAAGSSLTPVARISAGGGAFTDNSGIKWAADAGYVGGGTYRTSAAIRGAADPRLYQRERWGMSGYDVPVPASGTYRVKLDLAEIYYDAAGQRVFSVSAGDRVVVSNLDIFAAVGKNAAYAVTFDAPVTGRTLHLTFAATVDSAKVSGIEVFAVAMAPSPTPTTQPSPTPTLTPTPTPAPAPRGRTYPLHTGVVSTSFWVGEIFDPSASDGSQVISTYDGQWQVHYGGCDGVVQGGGCQTEKREAANGYFPSQMTPRQNPFYLDLPFDDLNDGLAFAQRSAVVPWAHDAGYAGHDADAGFSYMKNRWVKLMRTGHTCYAQIEDAGPGQYHDATYVFGADNRRPSNQRFNNAGMDVSPAVNGCLAFSELDGENDQVDWQFVDASDVPAGPWTRTVTTEPVHN